MDFRGKALLGTCGWSYDDWQGSFYPQGLSKRDRLEVYARRFGTVEIDSTFYAIPALQTVQSWRERTPDGFVFSAKFPRLISHENRLEESGSLAQSFVETMSELGPKLGALLLQLPPGMTIQNFDALARFLEGLPDGYLYAVEVRDRSWLVEPFAKLLKKWQVTLALTDSNHMERFWRVTSTVAYVRLLGRWNQFEVYDRLQRDVAADLNWWVPRMEHFLSRGGAVLTYVNNNFAGHSPAVVEAARRRLDSAYLRKEFASPEPIVPGILPGLAERGDGDESS